MKTVKKFSSFEEMKSYSSASGKQASAAKKHEAFKSVIEGFRVEDTQKENQQATLKQHGKHS